MGHKVRTFRGKMIDIDEIRLKNEEAIAVGNMNVNARGDELDEWGNIVKPRDQVAREKNSSMSRKTTNASVISSFEDDDDVYELKDDPNVLSKNRKQPTNPNTRQTAKTDEKKVENKDDSKDTKADETDLD